MPERLRILVVDDGAGMLDCVSVILEEAGFTVTTAEDPDQALIQAEVLRPLLMVLDPRFTRDDDGAGLLRRLRAAYRLRSMPVVVLTALDPAKALGMIPQDPLVRIAFKPPKRETLLGEIFQLLPLRPRRRADVP